MTLGDAFPQELDRVREILAEYIHIGASGRFGATWIGELVHEAEDAMRQGDAVEMLRLYAKLQKVK